MRISDWISDVCSSDLCTMRRHRSRSCSLSATRTHAFTTSLSGTTVSLIRMPDAESLIRSPVISSHEQYLKRIDIDGVLRAAACRCSAPIRTSDTDRHDLMLDPFKIGSASCRERVCQYV